MSSRAVRDLELRLTDLARDIEFPETPDVAGHVRVAIESRRPRPVTPGWQRPAYVALAALLLATGVLVGSPAARHAVADFIGVPGIRVESGATPTQSPLGQDLNLGRATSLQKASGSVAFDVAVPRNVTPENVFVADDVPGHRVSLLFRAGTELPETTETGAGALLVEFQGSPDQQFIKKLTLTGTNVRAATVSGPFGGAGYWISGDPHLLLYLDRQGEPVEDETRLAGNTLIWDSNGTTFRLESALHLRGAKKLAGSLIGARADG